MTIATVQFMSQVLWREVTYTALLPDETVVGSGPYPVLYQLHGGNQNHTAWLHASKLLHYARDLSLIVILPDGAQSRWANGGPPFTAYEDFLIEELSGHIRHTFPATSDHNDIKLCKLNEGSELQNPAPGRFGSQELYVQPHNISRTWSATRARATYWGCGIE